MSKTTEPLASTTPTEEIKMQKLQIPEWLFDRLVAGAKPVGRREGGTTYVIEPPIAQPPSAWVSDEHDGSQRAFYLLIEMPDQLARCRIVATGHDRSDNPDQELVSIVEVSDVERKIALLKECGYTEFSTSVVMVPAVRAKIGDVRAIELPDDSLEICAEIVVVGPEHTVAIGEVIVRESMFGIVRTFGALRNWADAGVRRWLDEAGAGDGRLNRINAIETAVADAMQRRRGALPRRPKPRCECGAVKGHKFACWATDRRASIEVVGDEPMETK